MSNKGNQSQPRVLMPQSFTEVIGVLFDAVSQIEQTAYPQRLLLDAIHQVVLLNEMHRDSEATIVTIESVNHELAEQLNDSVAAVSKEERKVAQLNQALFQLQREKEELRECLRATPTLDELLPNLLIEIHCKIKERCHFSEEDRLAIGQCVSEVFREVDPQGGVSGEVK